MRRASVGRSRLLFVIGTFVIGTGRQEEPFDIRAGSRPRKNSADEDDPKPLGRPGLIVRDSLLQTGTRFIFMATPPT
jgi:hypothetical protein